MFMHFYFYLQNAQTKDVKAIEFEETTSATTLSVISNQGIIFVIFSMLVVLFLWAVILS